MHWPDHIRERHIRRFIIFGLFVFFILTNWGDTANGIYHLVLSARASFYSVVDGKLAQDIGDSTLSFGKTVTRLIILACLWKSFDYALKWLDPDSEFKQNEMATLRQETGKYSEDLKLILPVLKSLYETIEKAPANTSLLSKQQDRISELSVLFQQLELKTKNSSELPELLKAPSEDDLFAPAPKTRKAKKPAPSRLRRRPKPKF